MSSIYPGKSYIGMDNIRAVRHFTAADFSDWNAGKRLQQYRRNPAILVSLQGLRRFPYISSLSCHAGEYLALRHGSMDARYVSRILDFCFGPENERMAAKGNQDMNKEKSQ